MSSRQQAIGAGVAVVAVAWYLSAAPTSSLSPSSVAQNTQASVKLDDRPYELRWKLADMVLRDAAD